MRLGVGVDVGGGGGEREKLCTRTMYRGEDHRPPHNEQIGLFEHNNRNLSCLNCANCVCTAILNIAYMVSHVCTILRGSIQ